MVGVPNLSICGGGGGSGSNELWQMIFLLRPFLLINNKCPSIEIEDEKCIFKNLFARNST